MTSSRAQQPVEERLADRRARGRVSVRVETRCAALTVTTRAAYRSVPRLRMPLLVGGGGRRACQSALLTRAPEPSRRR